MQGSLAGGGHGVTTWKHGRRCGSSRCCRTSRIKSCLKHHDTHSRHARRSRHSPPAYMSHISHKTCISRISLVYRKTRSLLCSCVQLIVHSDCLVYNNTRPLLQYCILAVACILVQLHPSPVQYSRLTSRIYTAVLPLYNLQIVASRDSLTTGISAFRDDC
jgi:hypothetical protein